MTDKIYNDLFGEYRDYQQPLTFAELIDKMESVSERRDMSEKDQGGFSDEATMGDFQYGVTSVPIRWVLPIIKYYCGRVNEN